MLYHEIVQVLTTINWGHESWVGVRPVCISNREGTSIENSQHGMVCMGTCVRRRHVYQIDTYILSKVFLMCTSSVLSLVWFLCWMPN